MAKAMSCNGKRRLFEEKPDRRSALPPQLRYGCREFSKARFATTIRRSALKGFDEVVGAAFDGGNSRLAIAVTGDQHARQFGMLLLEASSS